MKTRCAVVAAMALALAVPSLRASSQTEFMTKAPAKSHPAAATRTVTLDLTGMD
jgi:hypothetical protein